MMKLGFVLAGSIGAETAENVKEVAKWLENTKESAIQFGIRLVFALIFIFIARKLIKWAKKICNRSFERSKMEAGVHKFLVSLINILLNVVMLVVAVRILGVESTSLAAIVGSAGLTIGLALQGSLSNFAGGVLILIMKPFRMGDYIIAEGKEGTVTGIDIFYTKLLTADNQKVVIPNGGLSNSSIVNVTNEDVRRLDLTVPVSHDSDIKKVKQALNKLLASEQAILTDQPASVYIDSFKEGSIVIGIRAWTKKEDYWDLRCDLLEKIKETFDKEQITIPFNQFDISIKTNGAN